MQFQAVQEYTKDQILDKTREVSIKTKELLNQIVLCIKPGMKESEAKTKAQELHKEFGVEKNWHNPYIRFGTNTILTFQDKTNEDRILQENDIAYVDIGPIMNGIEGDAGCTVVFGEDKLFKELKFQSENIFSLGGKFWREKNPTGIELYEYIKKETEKAGFIFNLNTAGHLIGAFPHKGWKDGLNIYDYYPEPGYWILEIQIRSKEFSYGAFYEDVLL